MREDLRELRRLLGTGEVEFGGGPIQGDPIEKPQTVANGVAALPSQVPFLAEMEQVVLDLLHGELIGTAVVVTGQAGHRLQVGFLRVLGQIADPQVVVHFLSERAHGVLLRSIDGKRLTPL